MENLTTEKNQEFDRKEKLPVDMKSVWDELINVQEKYCTGTTSPELTVYGLESTNALLSSLSAKKEEFPKTNRLFESLKAETNDETAALRAFEMAKEKLSFAAKALEDGNLKDLKALLDGLEKNKYGATLLKSLLSEKYGINARVGKDGSMEVIYHYEELPVSCPIFITKALHLSTEGKVSATKTMEGGFANIRNTKPLDTATALAEVKEKVQARSK